jgi:hypothetical protein
MTQTSAIEVDGPKKLVLLFSTFLQGGQRIPALPFVQNVNKVKNRPTLVYSSSGEMLIEIRVLVEKGLI